MEVSGLNSGRVVFNINFLYTHGYCSIRVSRSSNFTLVCFLFYNFVIVILLLIKLSKCTGTATMISLSTQQFPSYTRFTL